MPLTEEQERDLIRRIIAGDINLFAQLLEEHNRRIYQFIWRHVRDASLSTELTHECFVKAYHGLKKFRGDVRLIYWLERIALNQIRTFSTSKRGREMRLWESIDENPSLKEGAKSPEEQAADRELLTRVRLELSKMKPKFAEVVFLCVLNDRPTHEVAAILGIPEGTVLSRLNRGLKELMKRIK